MGLVRSNRGALPAETSVQDLLRRPFFVFDFDGVLANSVEVKTAAFAEIYRPYGDEIMRRVVEHHRLNGGMSRFEKFVTYHREFVGKSIDDAELKQLCERFAKLVTDKVIASPEIAGATEFVCRAGALGRKCAVNSATPSREIDDIVMRRGLNQFFCAVRGSPASKAQNLHDLLLASKQQARDAVFFGDAESDFLAAQECNTGFIGIGAFMRNFARTTRRGFPVADDFSPLLAVLG